MSHEPEVLDALIVGGGPGGTAAAFRCRELGLSALVIEHDDLMKRIRDYSKDKLILPSFGGGDQMCFPLGDSMVAGLCFAPIDKDEICDRWKGLYRQHGVTTCVGIELTGLDRRPDGVYEVRCWDHGERRDASFLARHVVLALGRGVPRRFDIPGNTDGIALRLTDPQVYLGRPSLVIGGGTSAAEAAIALSNAKIRAGDPTGVYWSYRGDKMPRVSKALAEVFFEAYVGNGNIHYYPRSEPAAVITGEDHREYLAMRVDRRRIDGRPAETTHLEFPKESCVACIGEDLPEALLASLGIPMAVGGPRRRKRMVVNCCLETCQPHVYLIGDILSQAYFETEDFDADPGGFREVKHRGNIKSALRDGVLVAQIIHQRLQGKTELDLTVGDAEEPAGSTSRIVALSMPTEEEARAAAATPGGAARPPVSAAGAASSAVLVRLLPGGGEEDEHPLAMDSITSLGRSGCDLSFPEDTALAARHASVALTSGGCSLRAESDAGGVFLEVPSARRLALGDGDLIRIGRQFLLFAVGVGGISFAHFDARGKELGRHRLREGTVVLGRKAPDITLDRDDGTLSRRHLSLTLSGSKLLAKDLKSANGSYLQVRGAIDLAHGDRFRVGQQRFVFSDRADAVLDVAPADASSVSLERPKALEAPAAAFASQAGGAPPAPQEAPASGPSVTFRGLGTFPVQPGQTLCEVAEANGVAINAECHSGICGSDPLRILSGAENLDGGPGDGESETLEDICGLEPGPCRLACMARIKGPVEVELIEG